MQVDILDGGPDNRQATGLRREDVDLIGALAHIAEQAFDGIRGLNMPMHWLGKSIKREKMLFVLRQAADRFGIALSVLGFESCQLGQCLLCVWLLPDPNKFGLHGATLAPGDGIEHVALFMDQTALTRRSGKQL